MMTERLKKAINEQMNAELWSANLYLSMSFYLKKEGYDGFAHWMFKQYEEEVQHATQMAHYLIKREATPKIDKIDVVPQSWGTVTEAFEDAYKHERHVSQLIDLLVKIAAEEKDNATQDFLWGFVREQVEEEATVLAIVEKLRKAGEAGIIVMDAQLHTR